jgi:predicted amidophosphoribosyltransferase
MGGGVEDRPGFVRPPEAVNQRCNRPPRFLAPASRAVAVSLRVLEWGLQALLDLLVEDCCVLCGRATHSGPPQHTPLRYGRRAEALAQPVRTPFLGVFAIENHPVCLHCAEQLDVTHGPGVLGAVVGPSAVETVAGQRFDAPASLQGGCGPQPAATLPVGAAYVGVEIPVIAPFMTSDNILKLIHLMKFGGYGALVRLVGASMGRAVRHHHGPVPESAVVVPVPMWRRTRKARSINHAERIADELSAVLNRPMVADDLRKITQTSRQSRTPRSARARNVRGVFTAGGTGVAGRHVFLVDDLVTSGATAASCACALLGAGARSVTVLCFGRAL